MPFTALVRSLRRSALTADLESKLQIGTPLVLQGLARLGKGLVSSALAGESPLAVITATVEEAGRWVAQLEAMGWAVVHFYPTSEASPYEPGGLEMEMTWGQMQVLADLGSRAKMAVVASERALQPHLPSARQFHSACEQLRPGIDYSPTALGSVLTRLGYERVAQVETEGQWSQRGGILDLFPVAAELPVRLEWFGDQLEQLREFDPVTQRSLDQIPQLLLTPRDYSPFAPGDMGASLLDYLSPSTLVVVDEPEQCQAHGESWFARAQEAYQGLGSPQPSRHRPPQETLGAVTQFPCLHLRQLSNGDGINLASRPVPAVPHQFARLAETLRTEIHQGSSIWLISAQPSRSVSLLQEHDCPAQFVANPRDYPALERLVSLKVPVALKYSGLAELEGIILPPWRLVVVTDREFFGQHALATPSYVRKRRRAASRQVDPNKLQPGDYVVHRHHGIGRFLRLERLANREYLVLQYADGEIRVPADQLAVLSRFRSQGESTPSLSPMSGKGWERTKAKVRRAIRKLAVDLLQLYAQRSTQVGFAYPPDMPWQRELEESFPYALTPDQIKSTLDVKRDMESPRPMDRLVCGDVGFGKTEVALRAIFKAVLAGKQVAVLAPTTILTQQHYHTLQERFAPYPIQVGLLNRFRTPQERQQIHQRLATGEMDVVVGTHQILGKEVRFRDLGLLVVDEEQRFGVGQKEKIKVLKTQVDVLTLSATPIPRTLYMALSGVREMSLITTPPPTRRPIKTHFAPYDPETVRTALCQELDRGGQVFYVVSRVEGIEEVAECLQAMVPGARLAVAHGQMPEADLETTMLTFSNAGADILVCTTIIESGLDIPRVNTILIEDAQRFGLSQLYQLRGRVGRSGVQAHAWLFYPAGEALSDLARRRLQALQEFSQLGSGYQLAVRDMEIRGVGNILGAEQSGQMADVGFDLYAEMLQEEICRVQGQTIPPVDDTKIELAVMAFIPADYIPDLDQKMSAYRSLAASSTQQELAQIALDWSDRYGPIPPPALQLFQVMELKQRARPLGFSRIRPEGKQHVILETAMDEPAWQGLQEQLTSGVRSRFVYSPGKVTVRGLGLLPVDQQLTNLIQWLGQIRVP